METGTGQVRRAAFAGGPELWVPAAGAALAVGTVAYGLLATARGADLGAELAPFFWEWRPDLEPTALPAVAIAAGTAALAPGLRSPSIGPVRFALATLAVGLALRMAFGAARNGVTGLYEVYEIGKLEAANEYLPALPALEFGAHFFLDTFAEVGTALPVHAVGHPPGLLLALHWLGIDSAAGMAALTIAAGALSIPLAYLLARSLLDERRARTATLLFMLAPSAVVYGATSADALYATLALLAAIPLAGAATGASGARLAGGGAALAVASFFSYANHAIAAWATVLAARARGPRRALLVATACAGALAAFYLAVHLATGYDPIGAIESANTVYREGVASRRPYAFWVFGSPVAYLVALGLPTAWLALRSAGAGYAPAVALVAVLAVAAALGFTKAETERIYQFLVPLACVAAAATLHERRLRLVLGLLAAQALATELLLFTVW